MSLNVSSVLGIVMTTLLAGCSMVLQPPVSLNRETDPYPSAYEEIVRRYLDRFDQEPEAVSGQLSEPAVAIESMFGPRRWYVCHRSNVGKETVIFLIDGKGQSIAGPSPFFCQDKTYHAV